MGGEQIKNPTLKIIVIGGKEDLLGSLFPQRVKNDIFKKESENLKIPYTCRKFTKEFDKLNIEIIWEAFLIENITEENYEGSLDLIHSMLDLKDKDEEGVSIKEYKNKKKHKKSIYDRKYIIIKFGAENLKYLLYMLNDQTSRVDLPQIGVVCDKPLDEECSKILYDNRFITFIEESEKNKLTCSNIFSYLLDRENYFNERGSILNDCTPSKIMKINGEINSNINILVCGISRSGKSTLINLLSRKLVSLESPESKSITRKITEYLLERKGEKIGIKLIDTPGLEIFKEGGKTINYIKTVIDLIKSKMKECEDSKDDIHMIYFVFGNNTNLEGKIEFFQFLQKVNSKRLKNNRKKIPIIFIGNHIGKDGEEAIRKFLKDNGLKDLIENFENKKGHIDFKKYGKKSQKNESSKSDIEDNIIKVNLLAEKEMQSHIYGIDKLLKTTLFILRKNNPFNNFIELGEMNEKIQKYLTKLNNEIKLSKEEEKDFIISKKEIKDLMLQISEENYLFNQIKSDKDIIINARQKAQKWVFAFMIGGLAIGCLPIPFVNSVLTYIYFGGMIIKIGNCYLFSFREIPIKDFIKLIFGFDTKVEKSNENNFIQEIVNSIQIAWNLGEKIFGKVNKEKFGEIGNKLGTELAKKIGEQKVKEWGFSHLHFVPKGMGRPIFKTEIKEVIMKEKYKFNIITEKLIKYIPSINSGFDAGVKKQADFLGNEVRNIYFNNTKCFPVEKLTKLCKDRANEYSSKITEEIGKYINTGKTVQFISNSFPVIMCLANGALNCYSTYLTGANAIKYFDDYLERTLGCDYTINQKNTYMKIFKHLEDASDENYEDFEFNDYLLSNSDYLYYAQNTK